MKKKKNNMFNQSNPYKIDLANKVLGRSSTEVANILRGKNNVNFSPHILCKQKVIAYNVEKIKVTGNKMDEKLYYSHSGYAGHLKKTTLKELFQKNPCDVFKRSVSGMLPNNKLKKHWLKNLLIIKGNINENN